MKPFLSVDITTDKKNKIENGKEFIVAKISEQQSQALESATKTITELSDKSDLPLPLIII